MFTIMYQNKLYFHNKGRIILFESQEEARNFMNMFIQYSMDMLAQNGDIHAIMEAQMLPAQCQITSVDFDIDTVECGTVWARELFENIGR